MRGEVSESIIESAQVAQLAVCAGLDVLRGHYPIGVRTDHRLHLRRGPLCRQRGKGGLWSPVENVEHSKVNLMADGVQTGRSERFSLREQRLVVPPKSKQDARPYVVQPVQVGIGIVKGMR